MYDIYSNREKWKIAFLSIAFFIAIISVYVSNHFVNVLSTEEHRKMEIWAEAIRQLAVSSEDADQTLVLSVLQGNKTIPVVVIDEQSNVLWHANIKLPKDGSEDILLEKVERFKQGDHVIAIELANGQFQYLYYDESVILKLLGYYPYALLLVISLFVCLAFTILNTSKRSEQNRVWVGLSKETAHQLGTPISSLMAWVELLKTMDGVDRELLFDMDKDIQRLQLIADRFSKIGSNPSPQPADLNEVLETSLAYMRKRVSGKVQIKEQFIPMKYPVLLCDSLFAWVIENLCKNAIDAMEGQGTIVVSTSQKSEGWVIVDVSDTGKGIPRSKLKTVFRPGYTTKQRGWGLGLALVKRIIVEYHGGKIYVKESNVNTGTVFRIELRTFMS